jgi:choline dehydrogenase-like flavoprotein
MVREVTAGEDGRATGCVYLDAAGAEHRVRARVVCVCCSAVETARLLLLSRSPRFPDGLANGNGLVGRNLQFHGFSNGRGRFRHDRHPDLPLAGPQPFLGVSVMDHYFLPAGVADLPKGGILRFGFPGGGPVAQALRLAEDGAGGRIWGTALKRRLREQLVESRLVDFEVFHDFLPNERTYVELDPRARDRWGLPVARIHLDEPEHQRRAGAWLVDRGLAVLAAMGADEVAAEEIGASAPFLVLGTCRAGADPATSVVDGHGRAHEVPNLFVADGSIFPTSGGGPPTLTIMAQALRTAEQIDRLAGRGEM